MQNVLIPRNIRIFEQDKPTMVKSLVRFILGTLEIWGNLLWMNKTEGYIMDNLKMRKIKRRLYYARTHAHAHARAHTHTHTHHTTPHTHTPHHTTPHHTTHTHTHTHTLP
jgi:hypothetical protein